MYAAKPLSLYVKEDELIYDNLTLLPDMDVKARDCSQPYLICVRTLHQKSSFH